MKNSKYTRQSIMDLNDLDMVRNKLILGLLENVSNQVDKQIELIRNTPDDVIRSIAGTNVNVKATLKVLIKEIKP